MHVLSIFYQNVNFKVYNVIMKKCGYTFDAREFRKHFMQITNERSLS